MKIKAMKTKKIGGIARHLCAVAAFLGAGVSAYAASGPAPLAHWAFSTGTPADLASNGKAAAVSFVSAGGEKNTATITHSRGFVTLNAAAELLAVGINSTDYPVLKETATIVVTLRLDADVLKTAFSWGFVNQKGDDTKPWDGMCLGQLTNDAGGLFAYLFGGDMWVNSGQSVSPKVWFNVAITYNKGVVSYYYNGLLAGAPSTGTLKAVNPFAAFAVGRIFKGDSNPISVSDVQVYDSALTAEQIATLSSVALASTNAGK